MRADVVPDVIAKTHGRDQRAAPTNVHANVAERSHIAVAAPFGRPVRARAASPGPDR
jgi:hypothetical protein